MPVTVARATFSPHVASIERRVHSRGACEGGALLIRSARLRKLAAPVVLVLAAQGCAMQMKQEEKQAEQMSVSCATADGDLRLLRGEKAHVLEQLAMGVTAIYPAGAVVGIVTGTEGTKLQVATGEYNQKLDEKIAEIQRVCGVE